MTDVVAHRVQVQRQEFKLSRPSPQSPDCEKRATSPAIVAFSSMASCGTKI